MTFTLPRLITWLEETGHAGCAQDLMTTSRDHPWMVPDVAYHVAQHVEDDTPASLYGEAQYLPAELRAWADEQDRALAHRPVSGTFTTASGIRVTVRTRTGD
jgi:hypothetical protein